MVDSSLGTPAQLRDPNYTPPLGQAIPLGIQHVLAMFASNVTPAIIVAGAAGFGFGSNSPDFPNMLYMIQMSMLFAGIATLFQTIGFGPVGARLPIVQGTSFAFLPVMIPAVAGAGVGGLAGLMTGVMIGGVFHFCLGFVIGRIVALFSDAYVEVNGFVAGMVALGLVFSAFASEVFLGAFRGIGKGQYEAGSALGLSRFQTMQLIIVPQLIRLALPGLSNLWMVLLKDTALVSVIALDDLLRKTNIAVGATKEPFFFYFVACMIYLVMSIISSIGIDRINAWAQRGEAR